MRLHPLVLLPMLFLACDEADKSGGAGSSAVDADGDGHVSTADCNDANNTVYPGAPEVCDGLDNDCDGVADDNPPEGEGDLYYRDSDSDGIGTDLDTAWACELKPGFATTGGDCEDSIPTISPLAAEVCDGIDNDCDDDIDEEPIDGQLMYFDDDGDGYGLDEESEMMCAGDPSWVAQAGDCDDGNPDVNPGATEVCGNTLDEDCSGAHDDAPECGVVAGCLEVKERGLPDGTYTVDPGGSTGELEVECVDGATLIDSELILHNFGWVRFTESVSNWSGWTAAGYTGSTSDGFWVRTERNFSMNGYSMCVLIELDLPWAVELVGGGFSVDGHTNGSPDDDDGLSWNQAANSLGEGHVMFGARQSGGSYDTFKSSADWGQDFDSAGPRTFTMEDTETSAPTATLAWEYCDDGLRGEDIKVEAIELWVTEAP